MVHISLPLLRAFRIRNELGEIYSSLVIRKFALTLVNIFIPLYLLQIGIDLFIVIVFVLFHDAVKGMGASIAGFLDSRIGLKHTILLSVPLLLAFLALLLALNPAVTTIAAGQEVLILVLAAVVGGLAQTLYWTSLNAEFVKNADLVHSGKESSHLQAYPQFGTLLAPLAGGLILRWLGFDILFSVAILLVVVSVFPLFLTSDYKERFRLHPLLSKKRQDEMLLVGLAVQGMLMFAEVVAWPLYIFFRFGDVLPVGLAASLTALGVTLFTPLIGHISDRIRRDRLFVPGAAGLFLLWLAPLVITTLLEAFLLSFLLGLFLALVYVPLFAAFSEFARDDPVNRSVVREWLLGAGFVAAGMVVLAAGLQLEAAFVLAAVASLAFVAFR